MTSISVTFLSEANCLLIFQRRYINPCNDHQRFLNQNYFIHIVKGEGGPLQSQNLRFMIRMVSITISCDEKHKYLCRKWDMKS
jgi:hypothetical protein